MRADSISLDGMVCLITGCSSGFGWALMEEAAAAGCQVVATSRRTADIESFASSTGASVTPMQLDVRHAPSVQSLVSEIDRLFGRIDILINNAGVGYVSSIEEGEEEVVRDLFETNALGLFRVTRAVLPHMRKRRSGSIVNMSSALGLTGLAGTGYYSATKFAIEGWTEALATEVSPLGIRTMLAEPGPFRTRFSGSSMRLSPVQIEDYQATVGAFQSILPHYSGTEPGDPAAAARIIVDVLRRPTLPFRLPLGRMALQIATGKSIQLNEQAEECRTLAPQADFDDADVHSSGAR